MNPRCGYGHAVGSPYSLCRVCELERQVATMNSRCATDAASHERDQLLVAELRGALAEIGNRAGGHTMGYAPSVENDERERSLAWIASRVESALSTRRYRRNDAFYCKDGGDPRHGTSCWRCSGTAEEVDKLKCPSCSNCRELGDGCCSSCASEGA